VATRSEQDSGRPSVTSMASLKTVRLWENRNYSQKGSTFTSMRVWEDAIRLVLLYLTRNLVPSIPSGLVTSVQSSVLTIISLVTVERVITGREVTIPKELKSWTASWMLLAEKFKTAIVFKAYN
jgi:hypothetical protein